MIVKMVMKRITRKGVLHAEGSTKGDRCFRSRETEGHGGLFSEMTSELKHEGEEWASM